MYSSATQTGKITRSAKLSIGLQAGERPLDSCVHVQRGFTLVELITVMVIIGIVAVAAMPRFFDNTFQSRGFYDQVISTLRFAQKTAVAQHRFVCVTFTATTITLTHGAAPACGNALTSPTGVTPYIVTAPGGVTMAGGVNFNFDALGRPTPPQPGITVTGYATPIVVEAETGYVR
jgi:MSHA pilin protein MshC